MQSCSAQQTVLENYELLGVIFHGFDPEDSSERKDLYKSATTCKAFRRPALDQLWSYLPAFVPLLRLLPKLEEFEAQLYFTGDIRNPEFVEYANRVRSITLPVMTGKGPNFSGQLFTRLAKELAGSPLLPGLRKVIVKDLDVTASNFLPLLLTPSLQSLEVSANALSRQHTQRSLFPCLRADAPRLKHLSLSHSDATFILDPSILQRVTQLKGLETLDLGLPGTPISPDFVWSIGATFRRLRGLKLDIKFSHQNNVCPNVSKIEEKVDPFAYLHELHLVLRPNSGTCHLDSSIRFCTAWPPSFLNHLTSLIVHIQAAFTSLPELVQSLACSPCFRRLELKQVKGATHSAPLGAVLQLLTIATLEELILDVHSIACANDAEGEASVANLIDAAFCDQSRKAVLKTLVLPTYSAYPLGLTDLKGLLQKAMGLERLAVAIDSSAPTKITREITTEVVSESTIRHLQISDQRGAADFALMEYSHIATYLDRIAPNLEGLTVHKDSNGKGGAYQENWAFIDHWRRQQKLLRTFAQY